MLSAVYLFFPQKKAKKVYLIAVFVLLTLVMAFRSQQVGVDAAAYCSYYMRIGISDQFKIPVRYIGVGEGIDQLQVFDRKEFVDSLFS